MKFSLITLNIDVIIFMANNFSILMNPFLSFKFILFFGTNESYTSFLIEIKPFNNNRKLNKRKPRHL